MNETLFQILTLALPLIFAIVFHEVAHGYVAKLLGDPTASEEGRLTLNPLRHVDIFGTVLMPGMLALAHLPVFGFAKPVPVNKWKLRNPRRDMMLVAAAGPGINLVMALVAAVGIGLLVRWLGEGEALYENFWGDNLYNFLQINIFLALFNLIPLPPFDGSHIVEGILPARAAAWYRRIGRIGMLLPFLLLVILPQIFPHFDPLGRLILPPAKWLGEHLLFLGDWVARL